MLDSVVLAGRLSTPQEVTTSRLTLKRAQKFRLRFEVRNEASSPTTPQLPEEEQGQTQNKLHHSKSQGSLDQVRTWDPGEEETDWGTLALFGHLGNFILTTHNCLSLRCYY